MPFRASDQDVYLSKTSITSKPSEYLDSVFSLKQTAKITNNFQLPHGITKHSFCITNVMDRTIIIKTYISLGITIHVLY